jgi:predicted transcriptional regulator
MPTVAKPEFIIIPEEARSVIRDARTHLGLSRTVVEQRAKVGTDYIKKLELGRSPRAEAGRLRRVLQVVQQAAERGKAPTKLTARIARVAKAVAKPAPAAAKSAPAAKAAKR